MPQQNHARDVELTTQLLHVVCGPLECVVFEILGRVGLPVPDHVGCDDPVVLGEEEGDLVAPAEREVGPAVDEEDCGSGRAAWGSGEVMIPDAVECGEFVRDSGVGGGELVG